MQDMLNEPDRKRLIRFATGPKATAHIRFNGVRLRHDQLLERIAMEHPKLMAAALDRVVQHFDKAAVHQLLDKVDSRVRFEADRMRQEFHQELIAPQYHLTDTRKAFIRELLYLRHQELCKLREQIRG